MIAAMDLPVWLASVIAFLIVVGATLTLLGAFGFWRLPNFYDRIHAPALGTSWGTAGIALASMLFFSVTTDELVLHELVIGVFIMVTTPVTMMLLGGAAYARDEREAGFAPADPMADAAAEEADENEAEIAEETAEDNAASAQYKASRAAKTNDDHSA